MVSAACETYRWSIDYVIHDLPTAQLIAMTAASAWRQGMDLAGGSYSEIEIDKQITQWQE